MQKYKIELLAQPTPQELEHLAGIWERSVRATHDFLSERDIIDLRPIVRSALPQADLYVVRDENGEVLGFAGINSDMLKMLFMDDKARGRGAGSALFRHVMARGVRKLDVNEQNPAAKAFYERHGFTVNGRSDQDRHGNPFPVLHMTLAKS